jgi:hypothetical protein
VLEKEWYELLDTSSSSKHSWRAAVGFAGEDQSSMLVR